MDPQLAEFIAEKRRYLELPEEDIPSYMARRAAMRKASRLEKRRHGNNLQDSPIAPKKPRMFNDTDTGLPEKKEEIVVASGSSHTPVHVVANIRADERMDIDHSPPHPPVGTSSPHKPELLSKTSIKDRDGSIVVAPKSDSDVLYEQATSSKQPSTKLRRADIGRQASISLISHQRASRQSTSRSNAVIKITPKEASSTAAADTSNITTPASSPIDAPKKQRVSSHLDAIGNDRKRTTKAAALAEASCSTVESKNVSSAQDLSDPSTTNATNNVNRSITALPRLEPPKKKTATKKQAKEKPPKMTPPEYAELLIAKYSNPNRKVVQKNAQGLRGSTVFYVGGELNLVVESTRKRMEHILKYGGNLVSKFDPEVVTHIVTDTGESATAKAAGLKSISEVPMHIPTLRWSWVSSESGKRPVDPKVQNDTRYWDHVAFGSRFHAGESAYLKNKSVAPDKGKGKAVEDDPEDSRISEFTDSPNDDSLVSLIHPSKVLTARGLTSKAAGKMKEADKDDPLAEFYAQAKAEVNANSGWDIDESEDETLSSNILAPRVIGGEWACDQKRENVLGPSPNQDVVDKLKELQEVHRSKPGEDNSWRVFSYNKSLRSILNHPTRIKSYAEARSISGVGEKTALKIMEIIQSGELRRIGYENTDDVRVNKLFQGVFGVGMKTAFTWYANGARTLDDLLAGKGGIKLTSQQEIGIRFYNDINERMPRDEAEEIFKKIQLIALKIDPKLFIQIMGSFRRGAETCGDIDVLITRPTDDGKTHVGVVKKIWKECHAQGIITEDLVMPDDFDDLELIYRGLCRRDENSKRRRLDFLSVPWRCRGAALLYYTGDSIFNRSLRLKARKNGMSLNQRGLFGGVVRSVKDASMKTNEGLVIASETEQEILQILNVPWQEPHERVRGDVI